MSKLKIEEHLSSFLKNQFSFGRDGIEELVASFDREIILKSSIILRSGQMKKSLSLYILVSFVNTMPMKRLSVILFFSSPVNLLPIFSLFKAIKNAKMATMPHRC